MQEYWGYIFVVFFCVVSSITLVIAHNYLKRETIFVTVFFLIVLRSRHPPYSWGIWFRVGEENTMVLIKTNKSRNWLFGTYSRFCRITYSLVQTEKKICLKTSTRTYKAIVRITESPRKERLMFPGSAWGGRTQDRCFEVALSKVSSTCASGTHRVQPLTVLWVVNRIRCQLDQTMDESNDSTFWL